MDHPKQKTRASNRERSYNTISLSPDDQDLFEVLREHRLQLARDKNIPPYVVFSDRTLLDLVSIRPSNLEEMRQVNGVGATKLKRYGESFLALLQDYRT